MPVDDVAVPKEADDGAVGGGAYLADDDVLDDIALLGDGDIPSNINSSPFNEHKGHHSNTHTHTPHL